ncbi:MAG: general secretion pathway protein GspB [Methylococcales bacterium]|nr:general secretion pathway protein GspB [Methylococcales bacterium]
MSFILSALRKSEKERESTRPKNIRNRIQESTNNIQKKTPLWLIILFLTNIVLLLYIIWLITLKAEPNKGNEKPVESTKIVEKIHRTTAIKPVNIEKQKTTVFQHSNEIESTLDDTKNNKQLLSITQLVDHNQQKHLPKSKNDTVAPLKITSNLKQQSKTTTTIPYLSDLSPKFRLSVPDILINVFIYVEKEENRLIMINMKSFRVDQEIINNMILKEIRKKSIVVEYKNKTFQIRR